MRIINLTQHTSTPEQRAEGVLDLQGARLDELRRLLTFTDLPSRAEIIERAEKIARIAKDERAEAAMIGGAPFLMPALVNALLKQGIKPCFAFSRRESIEERQPDGSVRKVAIFRHLGFVWMEEEK